MGTDEPLRQREQDQALAVLRCMPGRRRELDETERMFIRNARDCGLTWKQIAGALGLDSPQAALQRHERLAVLAARAAVAAERETEREQARREADEEFDRRIVETLNRIFVHADSAGYVHARLKP